MAASAPKDRSQPDWATGALVLPDGTVFWGRGIGATGAAVGEVCFNTSITGYQEILTDPSYAGQIVAFTFPHIGNVGVNAEDVETRTRSEEHTSELQSLMRISYAVFCLKKKINNMTTNEHYNTPPQIHKQLIINIKA